MSAKVSESSGVDVGVAQSSIKLLDGPPLLVTRSAQLASRWMPGSRDVQPNPLLAEN